MIRSKIGRSWMAIRDMDIAASIQNKVEEVIIKISKNIADFDTPLQLAE